MDKTIERMHKKIISLRAKLTNLDAYWVPAPVHHLTGSETPAERTTALAHASESEIKAYGLVRYLRKFARKVKKAERLARQLQEEIAEIIPDVIAEHKAFHDRDAKAHADAD